MLNFKSFQSWLVFLLVLDFGFRPWLVLVDSQMDTVNREGAIVRVSDKTINHRRIFFLIIYPT